MMGILFLGELKKQKSEKYGDWKSLNSLKKEVLKVFEAS